MDLNYFKMSQSVARALKDKKPVLALESTIFSHGLPWPTNYELAQNICKTVSGAGCVPAITMIHNGFVVIGPDDSLMKKMCAGGGFIKTTYRDIGYVLSKGLSGGTTVSATRHLSSLVDIAVFSTGGIGGVHRNAALTFDVSQDIKIISKAPGVIVSSGAKSILDIPKTIEHLESLGVPIVGYNTNNFPAFYSRESGCLIDNIVHTPEEIAGVYFSNRRSSISSSLLVANPVPKNDEVPLDKIEPMITSAINDAENNGVSGKDLTPYLLKNIVNNFGEKCLTANASLALHNAALGAEISVEISRFNNG